MHSIILAIIFLVFSTPSFSILVGTVDLQKVLFSIKEGQQIRKKLETSFNQKKADLKKQEEKLKKSKEKFDKRAQVISEKARLKEQAGLQKMLLALETKRQKYQKENSGYGGPVDRSRGKKNLCYRGKSGQKC